MMSTILLTVAAAFLLGDPGRMEHTVGWADGWFAKRPVWERVALRLKGRVLGSLVKRGATRKQVERVLGEYKSLLKPLGSGGVVGCVSFSIYTRDDLGVSFTFVSDGEGVERAGPVQFTPLFGGPAFP